MHLVGQVAHFEPAKPPCLATGGPSLAQPYVRACLCSDPREADPVVGGTAQWPAFCRTAMHSLLCAASVEPCGTGEPCPSLGRAQTPKEAQKQRDGGGGGSQWSAAALQPLGRAALLWCTVVSARRAGEGGTQRAPQGESTGPSKPPSPFHMMLRDDPRLGPLSLLDARAVQSGGQVPIGRRESRSLATSRPSKAFVGWRGRRAGEGGCPPWDGAVPLKEGDGPWRRALLCWWGRGGVPRA